MPFRKEIFMATLKTEITSSIYGYILSDEEKYIRARELNDVTIVYDDEYDIQLGDGKFVELYDITHVYDDRYAISGSLTIDVEIEIEDRHYTWEEYTDYIYETTKAKVTKLLENAKELELDEVIVDVNENSDIKKFAVNHDIDAPKPLDYELEK